ncbi:Dihydroorotate dehydrogenase [Elusimicrobium minutum Pei191]|uniref:Dihydroorotate dehydrogenase n=1 Tax=Elusimicrobium minutum (strain Pei191) TaxID=445932 RepID=B2KCN8_ELUMP|nr:dihydroorotate dehydrogenase [Elusimicrobium minutum]ACC98284.1 Dihydroorotate dehydrogenase [Elusimicrobium minutum Pei191]
MVKINIGGLEFKNPVMTASGTFASGKEYSEFVDLNKLGAVVCKTVTLNQRDGNKPPRIADMPSAMLNSIGLENKGLEYFIENTLPFLKNFDTRTVASIAGNNVEDYTTLAKRLNECKEVHAIEVNMSCPNVVHGQNKGLFSQDEKTTFEIMSAVRKNTNKPIFGKISPMVADITVIAKAIERAGGDAVALINTIPAMGVDLKTRRPLLGNITGGLSGPAVKPVALKLVWDVYKAVKIPVIGMGGIMCAQDALEFILCGATAVQVGTGNFVNPKLTEETALGIEKYFKENNLSGVDDLKGKLNI